MQPMPSRAVPLLSAPEGRDYVKLVLVLGSLIAIGPLTIDTYLPAFPAIEADLLATEAQVQLTLTGMLLGLSLGQLVNGPASDALGRRRPLMMGLAAHVLASVLCALAPSAGTLALARVLQGVAGSAISVSCMAIVRDLFSGMGAAKLLSHLMLVNGVAPILAPTLGGLILQFTSWRGVFVVLGCIAAVQIAVAWFLLPETLPPSRRRSARPGRIVATYRHILTDAEFILLVCTAGLMFATMFSYISGASFVLQGTYGLSAQQFGIAFGVNALGLILMTQLNPLLLRRFSPLRILSVGVGVAATAALVMLGIALAGGAGLMGVLGPLTVIVASCGLCFPNAPALALTRHGEAAGSAAALLGAFQFGIGGLAAPIVGFVPGEGAVPMAVVMATTTCTAVALVLVIRGRRARHRAVARAGRERAATA